MSAQMNQQTDTQTGVQMNAPTGAQANTQTGAQPAAQSTNSNIATKKTAILNGSLLSYFMRKHRVLFIVMAICTAGYSVMIIALWPLMIDQSFQQMLEQLANTIPGLDTQSLVMSLGQYVETQWLGMYWLPLAGAIMIVIAAKAIAGSINDGSMETICAAPIKRTTYLNTVVLVLLIVSAVLSVATIVPLAALGPVFKAGFSAGTTALLLVASWLILFVFGLLILAISSWTRGLAPSVVIAVAFILVMLVLYLVIPLVDFLKILNPISLLHWWGSAGIIDNGTAEQGLWIWLAVVGVASLVVSYIGFHKRDLT